MTPSRSARRGGAGGADSRHKANTGQQCEAPNPPASDAAKESRPGLPDFPRLKSELDSFAMLFLRVRAQRADPAVAQVGATMQHEGHARFIQNDGGEKRYFNYERVESPIEIPTAEFLALPFEGLLAKLAGMANDLGNQQARLLFKKIGSESERAGTMLDAAGQPLTFDFFLEGLRRLQIDCDPATDQLIMPTLVLHPNQWQQLGPRFEEWQRDPVCQQRFDALMEEKRDEWRAREARRTLVD